MKLTGQRAQFFIDNFISANVVVGDGTITTSGGLKYFVIEKGASSTIPVASGSFFIAPIVGKTQITLVTGDRLLKIDPERFCKTTASFEFAMGSVDVGDDCDPGATISDGILTITGSLAGLFRYDDVTQDFDNVTDIIVNRFLDIVDDDGEGVYTIHPRSDVQIYLLTLLNSGGASGITENWLFVPINITSMSMSLGNADPQSKELSFSKGEGAPIIYKRPIA
jgi:hypothetical protein